MGKENKMKKSVFISLVASSVVLIILALVLVFSVLMVNAQKNTDTIIKGVVFNGIDLGGKTVEEAKVFISELEESPLSQIINLNYNEKVISFAPEGVGINYDVERISQRAYLIGRDGSGFDKLKDILNGKYNKIELEPDYEIDREFFKDAIATLVKEQGIVFKDYDVKLHESYALVKITNEAKQIDYEKLYEKVHEIISKNVEGNITLPLKEAEIITSEKIYNEIYVEPRNARADIINGATKITPQQIGILVNKEEIEKQLSSGNKEFKVKITKKYPEITTENLSGDFFNDVLATIKTNYDSKVVGRTTNLTLAARKINNTVLNPEDIFSFNKVVGKRSAETGFSTAIVYTNNGLQEEIGGGICQVSSTLYNAALYSDLKIVERKNHMYTVAYVKGGLDATVSYGLIDFRFQNNQSNPIKIVAKAGGGVLTISILGKKTQNNKVEISTQTTETYDFGEKEVGTTGLAAGVRKVKQNGSKGFKIIATKVVKNASGAVLRTESLGTSVYRPLDKIIEVGLDAKGNIPAVSIIEPITTEAPKATSEAGGAPETTEKPKEEVVTTPSPSPNGGISDSSSPTATAVPAPLITPIPSSTPNP